MAPTNVPSRKNDTRLCSLSTIEAKNIPNKNKKNSENLRQGIRITVVMLFLFETNVPTTRYVYFGAGEKFKIFGRMDYITVIVLIWILIGYWYVSYELPLGPRTAKSTGDFSRYVYYCAALYSMLLDTKKSHAYIRRKNNKAHIHAQATQRKKKKKRSRLLSSHRTALSTLHQSAVHPVSVLIIPPREIQILRSQTWETENQK